MDQAHERTGRRTGQHTGRQADDRTDEAGRERFTLDVRRFRQIAIVTTVGICVLVVAGGVVRLTGSGLGCDDWPNCNDTRFIDVSSGHAAIEQVNRLFSALIGVPTIVMAVGAFRVRPRRPDLRWPSVIVLASVLANGVVGGMAVRGDLHPLLVQSHFLLAMVSITSGLVAVRRAGADHSNRRSPDPPTRVAMAAVVAGTAVAVVTGTVVTGTGPHAGEEDVRRFGFDISAVARVHSVSVLVTVGLFVVLAALVWRDRARRDALGNDLSTWMFIAVVQGAIGWFQYFNGVPELLVGAHIAGATALWVATVLLALDVLGDGRAPVPTEDTSPAPTEAGSRPVDTTSSNRVVSSA